jgi:glyoxylase-like metal-dependent hydrolase (beta-lactamase superfamily II)
MTLEGTNTWILRAPDSQACIVVDPGPEDEDHLATVASCGPVATILLTHGHYDHSEGARRLADLTRAPVRALDPALRLGDEGLADGDVIAAAGLEIRVTATPGHSADSLSFVLGGPAGDTAVLTGDTILGRGTTVVAKPDGDLGAYLTSLDELAAYGKVLMLPGHGPAQPDVAELARVYREHRRERLAQVEAAMAAGADTPEKVVDLVYPDIEPGVRFAAEWSAAAQLDYLRHKNRESGTPADGLDRL